MSERKLTEAEARAEGYKPLTSGYTISENSAFDEFKLLLAALQTAPAARVLVEYYDDSNTRKVAIWTQQRRYHGGRIRPQHEKAVDAGASYAHSKRIVTSKQANH